MFHYIHGVAAELLTNIAVIDCGGVGFEINTSAYSLGQLKKGEKAKLYTYVYIREDTFDIYGFVTLSEKHCFEMLIGVSGVGPKAAISILSANTPEGLMMSIISEDEKALTTAQGIGKKIAQRIILELKDKMSKESRETGFTAEAFARPNVDTSGKLGQATAALAVLGYSTPEISSALKNVDIDGLELEDIIKAALKQMVK